MISSELGEEALRRWVRYLSIVIVAQEFQLEKNGFNKRNVSLTFYGVRAREPDKFRETGRAQKLHSPKMIGSEDCLIGADSK